MGNKVNGVTFAGQHLGSQQDFIIIASTVDFHANTFGSASQNALDKLVEIISLNGQPVIMGTPFQDASNSNKWTLKVAVEHTGAWDATSLLNAIVAHQTSGMGFTSGNTTVTIGGF
jgi:hypothetical protein